jgi:hypothetical protein
LLSWKLVNQLMKLLFPITQIASHTCSPPERLHSYFTVL